MRGGRTCLGQPAPDRKNHPCGSGDLPAADIVYLDAPSLIFGGLVDAFSPNNPTVPVLNDNAAITENMNSITNSVSDVLSEGLEDVLKQIEQDYNSSTADQREIINPHGKCSGV